MPVNAALQQFGGERQVSGLYRDCSGGVVVCLKAGVNQLRWAVKASRVKTEKGHQSYHDLYLRRGLMVFFQGICKAVSPDLSLNAQQESVSVCYGIPDVLDLNDSSPRACELKPQTLFLHFTLGLTFKR